MQGTLYRKVFSTKHIILLLTLLGAFLHFYNLNWGAPFYFHPDERNIASAVSQLSFPSQLNPNFFAYGSLPIYTIFSTGLLWNWLATFFTKQEFLSIIMFDQAVIISRFYSAFFATLLIPLTYLTGRKLLNDTAGLLAAALMTFSTGMIQFSHYGTFELWLTLFSICLFWHSVKVAEFGKISDIALTALIFGVLIATKISAAVLGILPLLAYVLYIRKRRNSPNQLKKPKSKRILQTVGVFILACLLLGGISGLTYVITNPYVLLDFPNFLNSIRYESSVGLGTLPVFYTGGFFDTVPVLYQFTSVYPFLVNPLNTLVLILSFCLILYKIIKTRNNMYALLCAFFLILFLSQAILFIKWTRNMIPTLPFAYLIISVASTSLFINIVERERYHRTKLFVISCIVGVSVIFSISYFITAFVQTDTRIAALQFAKETIPSNAKILSEPYDLGLITFNADFPQTDIFNFYELENNSYEATPDILLDKLARSDYILLPSQRILQTRITNEKKFPKGNEFYTNLLAENYDYQLVYQTPCDIFCQIAYLGDPVYSFEQTASVFDRPTIFIFKKQSMQAYRLEN